MEKDKIGLGTNIGAFSSFRMGFGPHKVANNFWDENKIGITNFQVFICLWQGHRGSLVNG